MREQRVLAKRQLRRVLPEQRRKRGDRTGLEVRIAHAVGPGNHHLRISRKCLQLALQLHTLCALFRKARCVHDRGRDALGVTASQRGQHLGGGQRNHRNVGRPGQRLHIGITGPPTDLGILRIHREHVPFEPELHQMIERHKADAPFGGRRTDDRNGTRIEQGSQITHCLGPLLSGSTCCGQSRHRARAPWRARILPTHA